MKNSPPKTTSSKAGSSSLMNTTLDTSAESSPATPLLEDEIDGPPNCQRTVPQHHVLHVNNNNNDNPCHYYYYRVVYRGVIALVNQPDSRSPKTGAYVSYGEIISSQYELDVEELESVATVAPPKEQPDYNFLGLTDSPPRSVHGGGSDVSSLDTAKTASSIGVGAVRIIYHPPPRHRVSKKAIRVDRVLTGGYAMDAASEVTMSASNMMEQHANNSFVTPRRSNGLLPMVGPSPLPLSPQRSMAGSKQSTNSNMEEQQPELGYILSTRKNVVLVEQISEPPLIEAGKFLYQVVSATPIPIFAGPCMDAPRTQAVLVPGTIHEVCLRFSNEDSSLTFLRLSHRRGWIPDRKVAYDVNPKSAIGGSMRVGSVPAVKEILASSENENMTMTASSIGSVIRRRHRPPRRKRELNQDTFMMTPQKQKQQENDQQNSIVSPLPEQYSMSSNISVLSIEDDEFTTSSPTKSKGTTPDRSIARSQIVHGTEARHSYFLLRANAPRGLQILDAPQFQVSNLITPRTSKSSQKVGNPAVFDSIKKQRMLPRGAIFEASRRMERSASFGSGLIKLSDNSGWAIVPSKEELDLQYRHYQHIGGAATVREGEASRAYEEVGNAMINTENETDCIWVRVVTRQGISVECSPPAIPLLPPNNNASPTSSAGGSSSTGASNMGGGLASLDSDVASSVGSAFLDAMFRTPLKKPPAEYPGSTRRPPHPFYASTDPSRDAACLLPCGMYFQINKWDDFEVGGGGGPAVAQVSKDHANMLQF